MIIHSKIYKKLYPVTNYVELQMLNEDERNLLADYIRKAPRYVENYVLSMAMKGKRFGYRIREDKLPEYHKELNQLTEKAKEVADKVEKGVYLSDEGIHLVNDVIYSRKYNAVWTALFNLFPMKENHSKIKK